MDERKLGVFYRYVVGFARYVEQREVFCALIYKDRPIRYHLHIRIIVNEPCSLSHGIEHDKNVDVSECMVEPRADDARQQKIVEAAPQCLLDRKNRIRIVLFTREDYRFHIHARILMGIKIPHYEIRTHSEHSHMSQAAVTEVKAVVITKKAFDALIVAYVRAAYHNTSHGSVLLFRAAIRQLCGFGLAVY